MAVADVVIKQEAVDVVDLEERVVQLCKENPKGITDQIISQDMPNIPPQQRVTAINRLLSMVGIPSWFPESTSPSLDLKSMSTSSPVVNAYVVVKVWILWRCE